MGGGPGQPVPRKDTQGRSIPDDAFEVAFTRLKQTGKLLVHPSGIEGLISAQAVRGFASMVQRKGLAMVALK